MKTKKKKNTNKKKKGLGFLGGQPPKNPIYFSSWNENKNENKRKIIEFNLFLLHQENSVCARNSWLFCGFILFEEMSLS